jgi:phthalate 4,5-cis-dihydrodiol dehydrogenase
MNQAAEQYGVKLLCGHTKSFDPAIRKMRSLIRAGRIGRLRMINTWNYNDFMVRPYPNRELEVSGGVVLNQGPHQVDVVRLLGGGMVRSVRAMAAAWDATRPEGAYSCYLEFEDGTPATIIFSGYGYFDTAELTWWLGEASYNGRNQDSRRAFNRIRGPQRERRLEELKEGVRYGEQAKDLTAHGWGLSDFSHARGHQRFYGLTVVSGDEGEMRQSQDGILVYGDENIEEIPVGEGLFGRQAEVTELYNAVAHGARMFHDGRWGQATLEVCLGILQSTAERKEIIMSHQVPVGD